MSSALVPTSVELSEHSEDNPAWLRLESEPAVWFNRFSAFRLLGESRSVRKVYLAHLRSKGRNPEDKAYDVPVSDHWLEAARKYRWVDRALAWDQHLISEEEVVVKERRRAATDVRRGMHDKMADKLHEFLDALDPNIHEVKPHELIKMGTLLNQDLRQEYEEPLRKKQAAEGQQAAGAITFEQLVQIAQSMPQPTVQVYVNNAPQQPEQTLEDVVDATYQEISQKNSQKIAEKSSENFSEKEPENVVDLRVPQNSPENRPKTYLTPLPPDVELEETNTEPDLGHIA